MIRPLLGFIAGLAACLLLTTLAGESPLLVGRVLLQSSLGSGEDLALTLFYATSLAFTGLAVAVAFHSGLFNIGAEGQLTFAAIATSGAGIALARIAGPDAGVLWSLPAAAAGIMAGALWGFLPGYFKVKRQAHEVIVTMMMNFIAAGLAAEFVIRFQNPSSQNPESLPLPESMGWWRWEQTPLNITALIAVLAAAGLWWALRRSAWGFKLRVTGLNEEAGPMNAVSPGAVRMQAMALAGGFAALVALNEILGSQLKFRLGFSPEFGFVGIAVALLARNHPLGILLSALLFGALQKGAGDLDLETENITRDFARILQAVVILSVSAFGMSNLKLRRKS